MRTEVVADPGGDGRCAVRVRCLQLQHRAVEAATPDGYEPVDTLDVDGTEWVTWDEAVEHEIDLEPFHLLPVPTTIETPVSLLPDVDDRDRWSGPTARSSVEWSAPPRRSRV